MNPSVLQCPPKWSPWPYVLVGSLLTTVAINIGFLCIAMSQPVLLVDKRPYESGLGYESTRAYKKLLQSFGVDFFTSFQPREDELRIQVIRTNAEKRVVHLRKVVFESLQSNERTVVEDLKVCGEDRYCVHVPASSRWWKMEIQCEVDKHSLTISKLINRPSEQLVRQRAFSFVGPMTSSHKEIAR